MHNFVTPSAGGGEGGREDGVNLPNMMGEMGD